MNPLLFFSIVVTLSIIDLFLTIKVIKLIKANSWLSSFGKKAEEFEANPLPRFYWKKFGFETGCLIQFVSGLSLLAILTYVIFTYLEGSSQALVIGAIFGMYCFVVSNNYAILSYNSNIVKFWKPLKIGDA